MIQPFAMERWQSRFENEVRCNLSESGVHPLSVDELLELAGAPDGLHGLRLGYGHSNGSPGLRDRIASLYPGATRDRIVVTNGGAEANFLVAWRLLEPGDTVAVLTPTYMQLPGLAAAFGAEVRPIPLDPACDWQVDPDRVRSAIDETTRLVVVTNPQNPSGAVLNETSLAAVLGRAEQVGAWVLADEVYAGAERPGAARPADTDPPVTPTLWGRYERVIATGSLSKAYGLPGLRIGWVVAPGELVEGVWSAKDYTTISPGPLTDALAALALGPAVRERLIRRARALIREHFDVVRDWAAASGRFELGPHRAGAVCFPRYDLPIASAELAERLRVEEDVLVVPGAHFDMGSYVRIGFGIERGPLEEGLDRIDTLVKRL